MNKSVSIFFIFLVSVFSLTAEDCIIRDGKAELHQYIKTTDRVKLREGQGLTAKMICVLEPETYAEITALGKRESIDGLNCSWIKINTGENEGWCYGGYLTDIFYGFEKEFSKKEIEDFFPEGSYISCCTDEMGEYIITLRKEKGTYYYSSGYFEDGVKVDRKVNPDSISVTYKPSYSWASNESECSGAYIVSFEDPESERPVEIKTGEFHKGEPVLVQNEFSVIFEGDHRFVTETAIRYSDHSEKSSPFGFNFVIRNYKMKNCSKVYKGNKHLVFGRSIIKYPFNGKNGWWYLVSEDIIEHNGEYLLQKEPGFYWIFEDFLSKPDNKTDPDWNALEEEFAKDGALRIGISEQGKWGPCITDWDHELTDGNSE